jgi:hypothetical protein
MRGHGRVAVYVIKTSEQAEPEMFLAEFLAAAVIAAS